MFFSKKEDKTDELEKEIESLRDQKQSLKDELADLRSKKKIEEEDIKHMVRLKEEREEVRFQKKEIEMEKKKEAAIATVKDEYRDKMEKRLIEETEQIKGMYSEVLKRLPEIKVKMKGDVS